MRTNLTDDKGNNILIEPQKIDSEVALKVLSDGELILHGLMPWSSNYTFLGTVVQESVKFNVIYKPCLGERPLWDFEHGTLCQREVASYVVSQALGGWPAIPPTVLRDGPHGSGSLQKFIHANYDIHYFTLKDKPQYKTTFQKLAIFDYLVNNADRKGGHCLLDYEGKVWAIDHGLAFHTEHKLRTVIWEYADEKIPSALYEVLQTFRDSFKPTNKTYQTLNKLLSQAEIEQFGYRLYKLLKSRKFPRPKGMYDYPYPPV